RYPICLPIVREIAVLVLKRPHRLRGDRHVHLSTPTRVIDLVTKPHLAQVNALHVLGKHHTQLVGEFTQARSLVNEIPRDKALVLFQRGATLGRQLLAGAFGGQHDTVDFRLTLPVNGQPGRTGTDVNVKPRLRWLRLAHNVQQNRTHTLLVVGLGQPVAVVDHVAHHSVTYCQRVRHVTTHCRVGVLQRPTVTQHSTNALNLAVQDFHTLRGVAVNEPINRFWFHVHAVVLDVVTGDLFGLLHRHVGQEDTVRVRGDNIRPGLGKSLRQAPNQHVSNQTHG